MQFIFTCSNGDVAFCKTESLRKIVDRIRSESSKTFLIQSKDPEKFNRLIFPDNVILGITLETNRNKNYGKYSKAPIPSKRYGDFLAVKHPLKMVTVEPVMDFDLNVMVHWIKKINPCMVWIGYDSKSNKLPEPELLKVLELHWQLSKAHITTILKKISPPADILPFSNKLTGG